MRDHYPTMMIDDGSPYQYKPRLPRQLYIQRFGGAASRRPALPSHSDPEAAGTVG